MKGKKSTVKTEGLEEVVVLGEEESNISEEPVLPSPTPPTEVTPPPIEVTTPPPTEVTTPPPIEETVPPPPVEVVTPTPTELPPLPPVVEEEPIAPPPTEVSIAPPPLPPAPTPVPSAPAPTPSVAPKAVYGFRVQIFASSNQKNATRIADDARSSFGGKVYIEHIPPYYKVRVGDCLTQEEALTLKNKALSLGYRGAFVVETMINP